uniref:Citrate transporter-like domain-containing protein n=1 Tax=Ignisphaera aggregans TaxID=334771 RepID=A0A7C5XHV4_9CREN
MVSFSMSSTIAGNLTILGVASNVIILEVLEIRMDVAITLFLKIGAIVTTINTLIYLLFFV